MHIACPTCRGLMVGDQIALGTPVICPHCRNQFVMNEAILAAAQPSPGQAPQGPAAPAPQSAAPGQWQAGAPGAPGYAPAQGPAGMVHGAVPAGPRPAPPRPAPMPAGYAPGPAPVVVAQQPAAGAQRPAGRQAGQETRPAPKKRSFSAMEQVLMVSGVFLVIALLLVVATGQNKRHTADTIGKSEEGLSTGPHVRIKYSSTTVTIINADPFDWTDCEVRINCDRHDNDAGGYKVHVGKVARGREKKLFLNQFMSPAGKAFSGDIECVVVRAKTSDGYHVRYVSYPGSDRQPASPERE